MVDKDNSGSSDELEAVCQMPKPVITAELSSPGSSVVHVKEEVVDPADVQSETCNIALKEENPFRTAPEDPHIKQLNVQESIKQENPDYCVDDKQTWNPTTKSLTEEPFPVTLYRVDTTFGMNQPLEINSSTLHNPDGQLNVPLPMSQLHEDSFDFFSSTNTCFTDNPAGTAKLEEIHNGDKRHSPYTRVWKSNLDVHLITHIKPYKCSLCPYSCAAKSHLITHERTHTGDKPYKCTFCPYSCTQISGLKRHVGTHTGDKPYKCSSYKCSLCPYSCALKSNLVTHERTHTGDKPYKCRFCPYSCAQSSGLKTHMRTHTGDKPYKCSSCPYSCVVKSHLITHERIHTGDKPYKCPFCPYSCAQSSGLKRHMGTHTGDKPYKCAVCPYGCALKSHLTTHERTHTGDKPYKCPFCPYNCAQSSGLKTHMRTHTGDKPYKCSLCPYSRALKNHLITHERTHTGLETHCQRQKRRK